ncbi:MAG: single-stranded-DNA-specific exonuclease RecJ [Proteobacteria bacterium]|nr:MAG: single-stranded-DNA-specific exonuclease RecJ [Pseudomonadota bacterium]
MAWRVREEPTLNSGLRPEDLAKTFQLPLWVATVLHHRMKHWGDHSLEAVKRFLEPSLKNLPDPFSLPDMDRGADRLAEAIVEGQKIGIYGDYDVDGTVGAAVLRRFLRRLGNDPVIYQPDRQKEGYGINAGAIEKLAEQGIQLLIAVDCGITSVKEVALANELGLDVIICDHHEPKEELPPAYAVLDHKRADNESTIQSLSGAGVAFYLCIAVRSVLRDIGHFDAENGGQPEPDVRELLDLVALATVADMVPLVDENRTLLAAGMDRMRKKPCVGLRELLRVTGVDPSEVSTYHLGFLLGPRINASGRLGTANAALELLSTDDPAEAKRLAEALDSVNLERMRLQGEVAEEALAQAAAQLEKYGKDLPAFVLSSDTWHEGVIGIVASKVTERYHRPVAIVTFATMVGKGKGSVRGVGSLDMTKALEDSAEFLGTFGGHKAAAGLSVTRENLEPFRASFAEAIGNQVSALYEGTRVLLRDVLADVILVNEEELTNKAVEAIERLGPFGMGNSEPTLLITGWKLAGTRTMKEKHLKIQLTTSQNKSLEGFWANGVGKAEITEGGHIDIVCLPQINTFRNQSKLELKIKDIRAHID